MNNRYNELTKLQQALFDQMINSVAYHKNDFADELTALAALAHPTDTSWYAAGVLPGQRPKRNTSRKAGA